MKLKIIIATCLFMISIVAQSQQDTTMKLHLPHRHEFSLNVGGGLSSLQYQSDIADFENGMGGQIGLGYTFFFTKRLGISTGIDFNLYNSKASLDNGFRSSYTTQSKGGLEPNENFTFTYTMNDYTESQQAWFLSIPIMLQFQPTHRFYVAAGFKIAFPVSATYETEDYSLATQGYFPSDGRTYNDLPEYGFGSYNKPSTSGDLDVKMAYLLALEAGFKWHLGMKYALYTGIYFDYGLNNIQNTNDKTFITYTGTSDMPTNSLVESQIGNQAVTDQIKPLALGIKLKFAFGCGK